MESSGIYESVKPIEAVRSYTASNKVLSFFVDALTAPTTECREKRRPGDSDPCEEPPLWETLIFRRRRRRAMSLWTRKLRKNKSKVVNSKHAFLERTYISRSIDWISSYRILSLHRTSTSHSIHNQKMSPRNGYEMRYFNFPSLIICVK